MEICGSTLGFALMHEQLLYSPQAQLDLDEICDYFSNELNDPDKGHGIVGDILAAVEQIPGRVLRYPPVGPLPFTTDAYFAVPQQRTTFCLPSPLRVRRKT